MKVLFVTQWFDPEPGAIRGLPLAKWLQERGFEVEVLTGFPNYPGGKIYPGYKQKLFKRENIDGISVIRVPLFPSHNNSAIPRILNYISFALSSTFIGSFLVKKPDVVYVYHPPPTVGLAGVVLKAIHRVPIVYHIADMWPESVLESGMVSSPRLKSIIEKGISWWCNFLYRQARYITVLSPGFKRLLMERGVPEEKIRIVYNWTDEDIFKPTVRDEALVESLETENRFVVMYAGNMGQLQGLETVIHAAAKVKDDSRIKFLMVGTGRQEDDLKALAKKLDASNVQFVGRQEYWDMPRFYALADALVVHLRKLPFFSATIPSKTQVSLSAAKPVIMAVEGDAADIVKNADAGLVCTPEDADEFAETVRKLASRSKEELDAMGMRGREFYLNEMSLECGGVEMGKIFKEAAAERAA